MVQLAANLTSNFYGIAISGQDAINKLKELNKEYIPNKLIVGSTTESNLPLLSNRFVLDTTLIYICVNNTCKMPTNKVHEVRKLMKVTYKK